MRKRFGNVIKTPTPSTPFGNNLLVFLITNQLYLNTIYQQPLILTLGIISYQYFNIDVAYCSVILELKKNKKNKSDRRTTMRPDFSDILYNLYDK